MTQSPRFHDAPLTATPSLERLLCTLERKLWLLVLLRSVALGLVTLVLVWAWAYFADFILAVPAPVRTAHGGLLVALPLFVLWRTGLRHLRNLPGRRELAILLEKRRGGEDLFTSATDFQLFKDSVPPSGARLVQRLFEHAEEAAASLKGELGVLDKRRPFKAAGLASLATIALTASFLIWPNHQTTFASRLFGKGPDWPQLTFLSIEVSLESGVSQTAEGLLVRVARGEDLPISVLVKGRIPDKVELLFSDGTRRTLSPSGSRGELAIFATTLRSISRDLSFSAIGGDDRRGLTRVDVKALSPPDITQLVAQVTPPAYSGLETQTFKNTDLVVLAGSRVEMIAQVAPPDTTGIVRILPQDRTVTLTPKTGGLGFDLTADSSLRLRFELLDPEGLSNPDPGLWSITVDEDRPPRVTIRSPETLNLETTTEGILPLWVAIEDDFIVESALLNVQARSNDASGRSLPLDLRSTEGTKHKVFAFAPIALKHLAQSLEPGQTLWAEISATDNRAPSAGIGHSPQISLRVLSNEDYMQRVQDRLAGTRRHVSDLFDLQREKLLRTEEIADALALDGDLGAAGHGDLNSAISGARRIEADAVGILRELSNLCSDVLHARIDTDASGQVEELDRLIANSSNATFNSEIWSSVVTKHQAGKLGKAGFAGHLIDLTGAGLDLAMGASKVAREALDLAGEQASHPANLGSTLDRALNLQRANLVQIEALLGRLAEWDSFQSVLSLTREVLDRQRAVKERIRELASQ